MDYVARCYLILKDDQRPLDSNPIDEAVEIHQR